MKKFALLLLFLAEGSFAQVPVIAVQGGSSNVLQESGTTTITCTANCTSLTWQVNRVTGGNSTVGTISGNNSTATYTAPASTVANNVWGGCPSSFNDSAWNIPVSALPLISNWRGDPFLNDAWYHTWTDAMITSPLFLDDTQNVTLVNNSTPTTNFQGNDNGASFHGMPWPLYPAHFREGGIYSYDFPNVDYHTVMVNTDTCQLYEVYNDHVASASSPTLPCTTPSGGNCYSASSFAVQGPTNSQSSYTRNGGTGAGGNMESPYLLHLSEIKSGVIKHAVYIRPPRGAVSSWTNLMWPATFGTGFCGQKDVVGLTITNGGSGYSASTTITFSGGGLATGAVAPKWAPVITGGVITGATLVTKGQPASSGVLFTSNPTVTIADSGGGSGATATATADFPCMPYGARLALDQTYLSTHAGSGCSAGSNCIPAGPALVVATALADYGGIVLDNCCGGVTWTWDGSSDIGQDPTVENAVKGMLNHITFNNFHIYDQSKLAISTLQGKNNQTGCSGSPCFYAGVLADNDLNYIPPSAVWITATNASGASKSTLLSLQAPTIGTPDPEIPILAGDYSGSKGTGGGYQIPFWVNGTSNTAVTWSCATCAANGSSITSGGIYTPPLSVSTTGLQDAAVCTLTADPNITATVYFDILPNAGNYDANTIRVDSGNSSNYGPDGNGNFWLGNVGVYMGDQNKLNDVWKYYRAPAGSGSEQTVYNTETTSSIGNDIYYKFIVPNGKYRVRMMSGWDNGSAGVISMTAANHFPLIVSGEDNGFGGIKILHWNMMRDAAFTYATQSNSDASFGELVTGNVFYAAIQGDYAQNYPNWNGWTHCSNSCSSVSILSGLDVEPDTSSPHWSLAVTNATSSSTPANFTHMNAAPSVSVGQQLLVYLQDWYTGIYDPQFSIVSGPGSLTPTTLGIQTTQAMPIAIYTAPATQPAANTGVIIKAQSQSNPSISATIRLQITGSGQGTASIPSFFK